jgi:alkylation response protein AidB-like acyl-CoA dehydrogenase
LRLDLSEHQQLMRETLARFLDEHSSTARVRAALPEGFDRKLWMGLAELGSFSIRVPMGAGGLGLGTLDAVVLMEEVGRSLASGPVAETVLSARLLALLGGAAQEGLLGKVTSGQSVVGIAFHDVARMPVQWVAGGSVADAVIARDGDRIILIDMPHTMRRGEPNLASNPIAELGLGGAASVELACGGEACLVFAQAIEEWKLLMAAALSGLAREALRLAAAYASERVAFGRFIGTYQGISHPLADLITDIDGGKYLVWKTIRDIADRTAGAGSAISLTAWWNADTAARTVTQALQTFGGYGLTTDYDIHLYNLRAKAWPLVFGDPERFLEEAGRRRYAGEQAPLPDVGPVSIDFDVGDEARALAAQTDAFFKQNLTPELKAKAHYSWDGHDAGLQRKLAAAKLLFPSWPPEWGGRNASPYAVNAVREMWEEHGWSGHATGTTLMVGEIIRRFGSDELKKEVLTRIASGESICSLGYSEPGSGSDVFAAKTRATPEGNGWRIDGQKMFTSGANITDYVFLLARTNQDAAKHKGLTTFMVPLKDAAVKVQPVYTFQDERTNITYYDGVRIPDSYRLGDVDGGVTVMSASLEMEHGGGYGKTQEMMLRAAEELCREIEFCDRPMIEDRLAQLRLARTAAHVAVSTVLNSRALWASVEKKPNLAFGPMAKLFSTEKFLSDSADLLNLAAPLSLSKRTGPAAFLNQCYRHAHGTRIYGGTSQVHRSLIAERNLGLPRTRG